MLVIVVGRVVFVVHGVGDLWCMMLVIEGVLFVEGVLVIAGVLFEVRGVGDCRWSCGACGAWCWRLSV